MPLLFMLGTSLMRLLFLREATARVMRVGWIFVAVLISYVVAPMPCLDRIRPRMFFSSSLIPLDDDFGSGRFRLLIFLKSH